MLIFYDSLIKPIFYIGVSPLYVAFSRSKYDQLKEERTDLAKFHPKMITVVLYNKVKWYTVTTAGNNLLHAFAKW